MYIDYKATIWFRISVTGREEQVLEAIKSGKSINELYVDFDAVLGNLNPLLDTEEIITPEENGGSSTIEVLDDKRNVIYQNGE